MLTTCRNLLCNWWALAFKQAKAGLDVCAFSILDCVRRCFSMFIILVVALLVMAGTSEKAKSQSQTNDDEPPSRLTLSTRALNNTVAENSGQVEILLTLDNPADAGGVRVTLSAASGTTAVANEDYTLPSAITIAEDASVGTATVMIINDDVDGEDLTLILAASADSLTTNTLSLTIKDDDTAGVELGVDTLPIVLGGTNSDYGVKLSSKPAGNVKVTASSANTEIATASKVMTFTPNDWNVEQKVTVTGVKAGKVNVNHSVTESADSKYPTSLRIAAVSVSVSSGICDRSQAIQGVLFQETGIYECARITGSDLENFTQLYMFGLDSLSDGDFDGLKNLETLTIESSSLTTLPSLSGLTKLDRLEVYYNSNLTSLPDLSKNTKLTVLNVNTNKLTSLPDLSKNIELKRIDAHNNVLTALPDLSKNTKLTALSVHNNKLTSLPDLSKNILLAELEAYNNALTALPDLSKNVKLSYFEVSGNPLSNLSNLILTDADGDEISLSPRFSSNTTDYTVSAPSGTLKVKVKPIATDTGVLPASLENDSRNKILITVDSPDSSQEISSGETSSFIPLNEAINNINITVNGRSFEQKTYTIEISTPTKWFHWVATSSEAEEDQGFSYLDGVLGELAPAEGLKLDVDYSYSDGASANDFVDASTGLNGIEYPVIGASANDFVDAPTEIQIVKDQYFNLKITYTTDDLVEFDKSVTITLSSKDTNWVPGPNGAKLKYTVKDNDARDAKVAFGSSDSTERYSQEVSEGFAEGYIDIPIVVNLLPSESTDFEVEVLSESTALIGDNQDNRDFQIADKTVTFGPTTEKTQNVRVNITNDKSFEEDESIVLGIKAKDSPIDDLGDLYQRDGQGSVAEITVTNDDIAAPSGLSVSSGYEELSLSWTAPSGSLSGYDVHYTSSANVDSDAAVGSDVATGWVDAEHNSGIANEQTISSLVNGTAYRVRVRATADGFSGEWAFGKGTPDGTAPTVEFVPANNTNVTNRGTNITLTFSEVIYADNYESLLEQYELARILTLKKTNVSGDDIDFTAAIATNNGKTVITIDPDSDLDGGAVYVAVSDEFYDKVGNQGSEANATFTVIPAEPAGLNVKSGNAQLVLSWSAPSGTISGYDIHYTSAESDRVLDSASASGNDASAAWVALTRSGTAVRQTISSLVNGTAYRVRVRATADGVSGEWAFGTGTPAIPDTTPPVAPQFSPTDGSVINNAGANITLTFDEKIYKSGGRETVIPA